MQAWRLSGVLSGPFAAAVQKGLALPAGMRCFILRAEPSRARAEPSRETANGLAEPSRARQPSRAEPSRAGISEPSRAEPSRAEPSRAEPSRAEPSRAEPSRAEPSREQHRRPSPPDRRPSPRGGHPAPSTASAAARPAGFARLAGAALLALVVGLALPAPAQAQDPPTLSSADVLEGFSNVISLNFSENLHGLSFVLPASITVAFTVTVDGVEGGFSSIAYSNKTLQITMGHL